MKGETRGKPATIGRPETMRGARSKTVSSKVAAVTACAALASQTRTFVPAALKKMPVSGGYHASALMGSLCASRTPARPGTANTAAVLSPAVTSSVSSSATPAVSNALMVPSLLPTSALAVSSSDGQQRVPAHERSVGGGAAN